MAQVLDAAGFNAAAIAQWLETVDKPSIQISSTLFCIFNIYTALHAFLYVKVLSIPASYIHQDCDEKGNFTIQVSFQGLFCYFFNSLRMPYSIFHNGLPLSFISLHLQVGSVESVGRSGGKAGRRKQSFPSRAAGPHSAPSERELQSWRQRYPATDQVRYWINDT